MEKNESIIDIEDDSYITHLMEIRKEEQSLLERLIAERKYLIETIKLDTLTGLYNRRIIPKIREIGTVIMCDIDNFKNINDTFGHDIGDSVIKAVAQSFLNNIRIGDVACRYGGDEFLVVLTTDNKDVVSSRLKIIEEETNEIVQLPDVRITLSIGVVFNEENEKIEELITKADDALYQSKENGKNQITYYGKPKQYVKETR